MRTLAEAWSLGDIESVVAQLDEAFVTDWSRSTGPYAGVYHGRDGLRNLFHAATEPWVDYRMSVDRLVEVGPELVVCESRAEARGSGSGVHVSAAGGIVWRFRAETPVSMEMFESYDEALAAARS